MKDFTETKFFFLRDAKRNPVACVASYVDVESRKVIFGLSTWNPRDVFDKEQGKAKAFYRLVFKPHATYARPAEAKSAILSYIAEVKAFPFPERARAAAKLWLQNQVWRPDPSELTSEPELKHTSPTHELFERTGQTAGIWQTVFCKNDTRILGQRQWRSKTKICKFCLDRRTCKPVGCEVTD